MTLLDSAFGVRALFLQGVQKLFRNRLNFGAGFTIADGVDSQNRPWTEIGVTPPSGAAAALISRTRYVDKGTSVAPENQTGTMDAPFATLAQAGESLINLEAGEVSPPYHYTIMCFPGNYSAETFQWWPSAYGISLTIAAAVPGDYAAGNVTLPALEGQSGVGQLRLVGVGALNGISGGWSSVRAVGCSLAGTIALGTGWLEAFDCVINQPSLTCGALHMRGGLLDITTLLCGGTSVTVFGAFDTFIGYLTFTGSAGVLKVDAVTDPGLSGTTITNGTKTVLS